MRGCDSERCTRCCVIRSRVPVERCREERGGTRGEAEGPVALLRRNSAKTHERYGCRFPFHHRPPTRTSLPLSFSLSHLYRSALVIDFGALVVPSRSRSRRPRHFGVSASVSVVGVGLRLVRSVARASLSSFRVLVVRQERASVASKIFGETIVVSVRMRARFGVDTQKQS